MAGWWGWVRLCVGLCSSIGGMTWAQRVVEGFEGGSVVLPCTISIQGDLRWRARVTILVLRLANGSALPPENTPWKNVISFVGSSNNLRISSLSHQRDDGTTLWCESLLGGGRQKTTVRVLAKIKGSSIEPTIEGQVTVTEGTPKTLTCSVIGNPNPSPSYSWTVDNGGVTGRKSNYTLTADRSIRSVTCTATNTYSNGSVLSTAEATAKLNVLYLDSPRYISPVSATESETAALRCSAEGNPPPAFEWRRSGSAEVKSTSADYTIENVRRSDAGEYTCDVTNSVGNRQTTVTLVVQYPSDVKVAYDQRSHTLTCTAVGVPDSHTFSPWEHRLGGTLIRRLGTLTTGIPVNYTLPDTLTTGIPVNYTLPDTLTYTDTGDYVCSATNGVKSLQTGMMYVAPLTPAVFQNHSHKLMISLGRSERFAMSFYVRSSSGKFGVRWEKAGDSGTLQPHREEPGMVSLIVYGQQVSLPGTVTVLTLTDVRQADEGNYSVTVTSDINGVIQTSQTNFYVTVSSDPTAAIIGGVIGSLVCAVIVTAVAVILWRRSKTTGSSGDGQERQISAIGEVSGEVRALPRIPETSDGSAVVQVQNYETLALSNPQSAGTRDQQYEALAVLGSAGGITHENSHVADTSTRTGQTAETSYESVSSM